MKKLFRFLLLIAFLPYTGHTQAVEMADTMRSEGKIYVLVAIILVLFTGLSLYLFRLDRKISRLEKERE